MSRIASTELILNADGSIYHLNLKPGDVAETVLLVGDPDRVAMVSRYFDKVILRKQKREFVTHTGYIGKKKLTVISTGIGVDNVDIVINELDALVNIDFSKRRVRNALTPLRLVRIGTSGALQKNIPVDSFVVSEGGVGFDSLLGYYSTPTDKKEKLLRQKLEEHFKTVTPYSLSLPAKPYFFFGSSRLLKQMGDGKFITGITATAPGFYAPQGRVLRGKLQFKYFIDCLTSFATNDYRITNFEMETAAIYGLARALDHDALSFNAIIGNRITNQFSKNPYKTVDALIKAVLEKVAG